MSSGDKGARQEPYPVEIPQPQVRCDETSITKTLQKPDVSCIRPREGGICGISLVVVESKSAAIKQTTQYVGAGRQICRFQDRYFCIV